MNTIENLQTELRPLRQTLRTHKLYKNLNSIENIGIFMEHHVFAVWDFMSLLKYLQSRLTTLHVPWIPAENANLAYFINDIVLGEETDVNELGQRKSHFEMYIEAMTQVNCDKSKIITFLNHIKSGESLEKSLKTCAIASFVNEFVTFTFDTINSKKDHLVAAAFAFGREDVIPDMFLEVLNNADPGNTLYPKLNYYLKRHIEVDGDLHGPLSCQMITELCGDDSKKWQDVLEVSKEALRKRIMLWDGINICIEKRNATL